MTMLSVPPEADDGRQPPVLDLRLLVLLAISGLMIWLAVARPETAVAITLGISVLYLLHQITR